MLVCLCVYICVCLHACVCRYECVSVCCVWCVVWRKRPYQCQSPSILQTKPTVPVRGAHPIILHTPLFCAPHYFAHTIILRTPLFRTHHYFAHPIILRTPLFCTHHYFAHTIILHLQQTDVQTWHQLHIWTSLAHHPFQHNDCSTSLQCNSFPLRRTYVSGCPIINIYYTPANKDNTKKTENFPGKFRTL